MSEFFNRHEDSEPDIDIIRLNAVRFLHSLKEFNTNVYPRLADFDPNDIDKGIEFDIKLLSDVLSFSKYITIDIFNTLKAKESPVAKFIDHDLKNYSNAIFGAIDLLKEGDPGFLLALSRDWPVFFSVMEDLMIRIFDKEGIGTDKRPLDIDFLEKSLANFLFSEKGADRLVKQKLVISGFSQDHDLDEGHHDMDRFRSALVDLHSLVQKDEEVVTQPGVLTNLLLNIIRNASKESVGANVVNFSFSREGDSLVLHVIDNGCGMSQDQLDPESSSYIFNQGENSSGTNSTGLGLANAPARLENIAAGKLSVWSRKSGQEKFNYFKNNTESSFPAETFHLKDNDFRTSTIFEIRLPITKKAA